MPWSDWYLPATQLAQEAAASPLEVPGSQSRHAAAPLALYLPPGQLKHALMLLAPGVVLYLPASQGKHWVVPAELQLPTAQHTPAPALLKTPEAQAWHVVAAEAPVAALKKLAPQLSQSERNRAPGVSLYRPTGQAVQDAVP